MSKKSSIAIAPSAVFLGDTLCIHHLPNPKSGKTTPFVVNDHNLFELIVWNDQHCVGSWFYGDAVVSDPQLTILSPIDTNFLFLSFLFTTSRKENFQTLKDLLSFLEDSEDRVFLENLVDFNSLEKYADCKEIESVKYFRFNQEKALVWLSEKVEAVKLKLQSFSKEPIESFILRSSVDMVREYLPDKLGEILGEKYGLPIVEEEVLKVPLIAGIPLGGRPKENDDNLSAPEAKKSKLSQGQQKLLKADKSGMKSIASFFGKK